MNTILTMNSTATDTFGSDVLIKSVQEELYPLWENLRGFGRVQRNVRDGITVPEWNNEGEYESVYFDDNYDGCFFFLEGDSHNSKDAFVFSTEVRICFMLNLKSLGLGDAEAADIAVKHLRNHSDGRYEVLGLEKGVANVFKGMDTSGIKFEDMYPMHCFAVRIDVNYYIENDG